MKTLQTVEQVRSGASKLTCSNNRLPVIVTIPLSKRKQDLGIQFWTPEQITSKQVEGCKLVEMF